MKKGQIKKGSELNCLSCISTYNKTVIEGKVMFDSWEGDKMCFVSLPSEPSGKRFLIESKNLIIEA